MRVEPQHLRTHFRQANKRPNCFSLSASRYLGLDAIGVSALGRCSTFLCSYLQGRTSSAFGIASYQHLSICIDIVCFSSLGCLTGVTNGAWDGSRSSGERFRLQGRVWFHQSRLTHYYCICCGISKTEDCSDTKINHKTCELAITSADSLIKSRPCAS